MSYQNQLAAPNRLNALGQAASPATGQSRPVGIFGSGQQVNRITYSSKKTQEVPRPPLEKVNEGSNNQKGSTQSRKDESQGTTGMLPVVCAVLSLLGVAGIVLGMLFGLGVLGNVPSPHGSLTTKQGSSLKTIESFAASQLKSLEQIQGPVINRTENKNFQELEDRKAKEAKDSKKDTVEAKTTQNKTVAPSSDKTGNKSQSPSTAPQKLIEPVTSSTKTPPPSSQSPKTNHLTSVSPVY